jgi:hypothetical protein
VIADGGVGLLCISAIGGQQWMEKSEMCQVYLHFNYSSRVFLLTLKKILIKINKLKKCRGFGTVCAYLAQGQIALVLCDTTLGEYDES